MTAHTFLVGAALDKAVRDIAGSDDPRCAVAFLGRRSPVIFQGGHARIICNLASGATNPDAVRELQKHNHDVRQNSRLHSKVYLGGGKALTASANLSANGLGFEDTEVAHWIEAGCYTEDVNGVANWFEELWNDPQTAPITNSDLQVAETLWKQRRSFKPTLSFSDFDAEALDVPLIVWFAEFEYKINPEYTDHDEINGKTVKKDEFYPIENECDRTFLTPGTWLLWWKRNANGHPSVLTECQWFRAGRLKDNYVKIGDDSKWNDAIIDQSEGIPPPFDCNEPLFNEIFRQTIMKDEFKALRDGKYEGSFLEGRVPLMRKMWPALKQAYVMKAKAR
ncbi:phospholipase D family protein [Komagataeibacter xylinus]|uniref:phospholipase D family protein n=1 Tax=Komagataeibacter xylinus TaxID=28448 RepID=UPI00280C0C31|nr:phospholipase D family protein [Komagataeibacter xylinus]